MDGCWKPLAFFSKKPNPAEAKYSAYDRELLAIYKAIKHFRYFIEDRRLNIFTDHKPLATMFVNKKQFYNPRQLRHMDYIGLTNDIRHLKSTGNTPALFRNISAVASSTIDYAAIAADQVSDSELQHLKDNPSLVMKKVTLPDSGIFLYADVSIDSVRPYVPQQHRQQVFLQVHGLSYPGIRASQQLIASRFFWEGINKDVRLWTWTGTCIKCQSSKVTRHTRSPAATFTPVTERFHHFYLEMVGLLLLSNGCRYILTFVDRFTRWPEAATIAD